MSTVEACIRAIISEQLDVPISKIDIKKRISTDLGADSLDKAAILIAIEEKFNTDITDDEAKKLVQIEDIFNLINRKINVFEG